MDKARVTFAISKANKNMERYIGLFEGEDSLRRVLEWKIKRILKWWFSFICISFFLYYWHPVEIEIKIIRANSIIL